MISYILAHVYPVTSPWGQLIIVMQRMHVGITERASFHGSMSMVFIHTAACHRWGTQSIYWLCPSPRSAEADPVVVWVLPQKFTCWNLNSMMHQCWVRDLAGGEWILVSGRLGCSRAWVNSHGTGSATPRTGHYQLRLAGILALLHIPLALSEKS